MAMRDKKRSAEMFRRSLDGETLQSIADSYGLSLSRVRQLVHWFTRMLLNPKHWQGEEGKYYGHGSVVEMRKHADFWKESIDVYLGVK